MPQEAWVLKCYQCKQFQVHLKKKAKKWDCKMCGAKQDRMTIFFKGQPCDCRVNVQNMNAAEGQIFEKLKELSSSKEENYSNNESESIEQNLPISAHFPNQNSDKFIEEAFGESEDFDHLEHEFQPRAFDIDGFNESQERSFKENISIQRQSTSNNSQSEHNNDKPIKDDDYFDLNSIDFTIKTHNPSSVVKKKEPLKLSIFESNSNFDESLDF